MTIFQDVLQRANERTAQRKQEAAQSKPLRKALAVDTHEGEKFCRVCKQWLVHAEFSPHKRTKDKLQTECKACHRLWWHKSKAALR